MLRTDLKAFVIEFQIHFCITIRHFSSIAVNVNVTGEYDKMRGFQQRAIQLANQSLLQSGKALLLMAPGSGKSLVASELAKFFMQSGPVLIVVDLRVIATQLQYQFGMLNIESKILDSKKTVEIDSVDRVIIIVASSLNSIQTLQLNLNLVIILDGYSNKKILLKEFASSSFNAVKKCLISSVAYPEALKIAGEITFSYSMSDAFTDGVLNKTEIISIKGFDPSLLTEQEMQNNIARWIIKNVYNKSTSKIVIICKNHSIAASLTMALNCSAEEEVAVTISSHDAMVNEKIHKFRGSDKLDIAVTINMFHFLSNIKISDVVLLRKCPSEDAFSKTLINCTPPLAADPKIWDFSDNRKYFFEEMGEFRTETVNLRTSNSKNRRKFINPLDDRPATTDMLGRIEIVDLIEKILTKGGRGNLNLALLGNWGIGKSSVLTMLQKNTFEKKELKFINYNAWHEEHTNAVLASIANQIIDELYESKNIFQQMLLNLKSRFISAKDNLTIELLMLLPMSFIAAYSTVDALKLTKASTFLTTALFGFAITFIITLIKTYFENPIAKKIRDIVKRKKFSDHIGLGQTIRHHLSYLFISDANSFTRCLSSKFPEPEAKKKYIITIDDLDRCSDGKIIDTVSALQLLSTIQNVNIILAIDYNSIAKAFTLKWKEQDHTLTEEQANIKSRIYLGKIFQASVSIDTPSRDNINNFIHKSLYKGVRKPETDSATDDKEQEIKFNDITDVIVEDIITTSPDELKFFEDNLEEENEPDEYLEENHDEYEIFVECSQVFRIGNPRTLIRLHNTITFIKGLNPGIMQNSTEIAMHIFLSFWYETWCGQSESNKFLMETALHNRSQGSQDKYIVLAQKFEIHKFSSAELQLMLKNVIKVSLPFCKIPTPFPTE